MVETNFVFIFLSKLLKIVNRKRRWKFGNW